MCIMSETTILHTLFPLKKNRPKRKPKGEKMRFSMLPYNTVIIYKNIEYAKRPGPR